MVAKNVNIVNGYQKKLYMINNGYVILKNSYLKKLRNVIHKYL